MKNKRDIEWKYEKWNLSLIAYVLMDFDAKI